MITLADYWMGRDIRYPADLTDVVIDNAAELLDRVNLLISHASQDGVQPVTDAATWTHVASGWRPKSVNDATSSAGKNSRHITGRAIDLRDDPVKRQLARWCLAHLDKLAEIGLWMEDPQWTPSWVHLQSIAPGSGRRVYIPSAHPPLATKLPEQMTGYVA